MEWNKDAVINYKSIAYTDGTALLDLERGKLAGTGKLPWQADDAIGNEPWGFAEGNTFKDARYVITNIFGEGPTESASGSFADQKKQFTAHGIRFTTKGEMLNAIAMGLPAGNLYITSLRKRRATELLPV